MTRSSCHASPRLALRAGLLLLISSVLPLGAQSVEASRRLLAEERFVTPPAEVARLVAAPRQLNSTLSDQSPDRRHLLVTHGTGLGDLQQYGKPHLYLAGLQVDQRANRVRTLTTRALGAMEVVNAATGTKVSIEIPSGATASSPSWSPDGSQLAFLANFDDASYVYVADARTGRSRRRGARAALPVLSTSLDWAPDGTALYAVLVPEPRMTMPVQPAVADGPLVRLSNPGVKNKTRTHASLLGSPFESRQLEYFATGQLARLDTDGRARAVGAPAMIQSVDVAPDGQHLRVTLLARPFSYLVPLSSFGTEEQLWTVDGRRVATLARRAVRETDAMDDAARTAADSGRRSFAWYPGGGLAFLLQDPAPRRARGAAADAAMPSDTAATAGDSATGPRRKDRLYVWRAPFDSGAARPIVESDNRMAGLVFTQDGKWVLLSESASGVAHTYAVSLADPSAKRTIFRARGATVGFGGGGGGGGRGGPADDGFYSNPGTVVLRRVLGAPAAVVSGDGRHVYLEGTQYDRNPQLTAPRSFIDRVELATGTKSRLFQSDTAVYESNLVALDDDYAQMVVTRETETVVPDQWRRDRASGQLLRLTENRDVTAEVTRLPRKQIQVTRADGYTFWVNVTLPQGYREGTRLPAFFWFYPYEYTDQAGYDRTRRTINKHRFPVAGPRSMEIMATQGYAIVQPDLPIFGSPGRMNDNYIVDLRNGLTAVIDELDSRGIIDRQRLGLGGHSYGAFSTVNAMVNVPYFKAGIAGDGNYNRTLTPNGFQSERRDLWEARETYLSMSPFLNADRLQGALLMYHSLEDQNTGTDLSNSIRLMHALQGMGKTASLYMYAYEDHGPAIKETLLDQWGRWVAWLDVHLKNAKPAAATTTALVP